MRPFLKWLASLLVLSGLSILLAWAWAWAWTGGSARRSLTTTSSGLTLEQIQTLSVLTTVKAEVADAVVTDLRGYLGDTKAVLVVRGEVTLGMDLSAARFEAIDEQARTAILVLPPPTVQSVRVDHERTRLVNVRTGGVWQVVPGGGDAEMAAVNRAYRDAQRIVGGVAEAPALIERARWQAEQVLRAFLGALGWRVEVR